MAWFDPRWELALLWLGALVHVPLALGLVLEPERALEPEALAPGVVARPVAYAPGSIRKDSTQLLLFASRLQLPAALLLVLAFTPGIPGFWFALPWLMLASLCGLAGVWRVLTQGARRPGVVADAGLVFFAGSGVWTAAAAAQWQMLDFPHLWVLLTAAHQLHAGLVLQVVASRVVGWRPNRVGVMAATCVTLGNPLIAAGIVVTRDGGPVWFEVGAACGYAAGAIILGWVQLFHALSPKSGLPLASRVLLVISDLSLGTGMTLAVIYAWGTLRGVPTLTLEQMIFWHASINAFGFGLCGLAGWLLAGRAARSAR